MHAQIHAKIHHMIKIKISETILFYVCWARIFKILFHYCFQNSWFRKYKIVTWKTKINQKNQPAPPPKKTRKVTVSIISYNFFPCISITWLKILPILLSYHNVHSIFSFQVFLDLHYSHFSPVTLWGIRFKSLRWLFAHIVVLCTTHSKLYLLYYMLT